MRKFSVGQRFLEEALFVPRNYWKGGLTEKGSKEILSIVVPLISVMEFKANFGCCVQHRATFIAQ